MDRPRPLALLAPTRRKLALAAGLFLVFPLLFALSRIPHQVDVLDVRLRSRELLHLLVGVPMRLFDAVTASRFASKSEAMLVFPTVVQLAAAAVLDALLFYVLACAWVHWRGRRRGGLHAAKGS